MQGQDMVTGLGVAAGFVAGTLVHTDKGLVPIEQLKVGDMVLSKHESGEGEVAYKRVLKTFKSPEKHRVIRIGYHQPGNLDPDYLKAIIQANNGAYNALFNENIPPGLSGEFYVFCTENHPFWTKEDGWVAAGDIAGSCNDGKSNEGVQYTFANMHDIPIFANGYGFKTPLNRTPIPGIAWLVDHDSGTDSFNESAALVDFRSGRPVHLYGIPRVDEFPGVSGCLASRCDTRQLMINFDESPDHPILRELIGMPLFKLEEEPDSFFLATVYDIEVEDCHTYFVGEAGVWVHHKNDNHTQHLKAYQQADCISNQLE